MPEETTSVATPEPPTAALSIAEEIPKEFARVVTQTGIEPLTAQSLMASYRPFFTEVNRLLEEAKQVDVTDATQVTMIRKARELRLALRKQRTQADACREGLKAESLRRSNAVQGMFNVLRFMTEPVEEKLLAAEEFAERVEQKRLADRKDARLMALKPYFVDTTYLDLMNMPEEAFSSLLDGAKRSHDAVEAKAKKDEEDRIAREKAEAAERERIRLENIRLKEETERAAEERKAAKEKRDHQLMMHGKRTEFIMSENLLTKDQLDFVPIGFYGEMTDGQFLNAIIDLRAQKENRERLQEEIARKEKEARERTEKALEEQRKANAEAVRIENERRDARDKEAMRARDAKAAEEKKKRDAEVAAIEKKANEDRVAREKAEREAAIMRQAEIDRQAAEKKRQDDERERQRAEAAAPDKEKLMAFAGAVRALSVPVLSTIDDQAIVQTLLDQREKFAAWIEKQAATL